MVVQEENCSENSFGQASDELKGLGELKDKNLLAGDEYQELRGLVLAKMKRALGETPASQPFANAVSSSASATAASADLSLLPAYGLLHRQIVEKIAAIPVEGGDDQRQFMLRLLATLADQHVLNPGDSPHLARLIDIASAPNLPDDIRPNDAKDSLMEALLMILTELHDINAKISQNPHASQTSKVLAQVTEQSGYQAAEEIRTQATRSSDGSKPKRLWQQLVQPDLVGGLAGAGAGSSLLIVPALMLGPIGVSTAGAVGALIGAGVSSGIAWRQQKKPVSGSPEMAGSTDAGKRTSPAPRNVSSSLQA